MFRGWELPTDHHIVYARAGGEWTEFVFQAITQHTVSRIEKRGMQCERQVGLAQWSKWRDQFPFYRELCQKQKLVCGLARSVIRCFLGGGVFDLSTPIVPWVLR